MEFEDTFICSHCNSPQADIGDLGICVSCGIELCVDCSQYGISCCNQEGWLCEDCIDEEKTQIFEEGENDD